MKKIKNKEKNIRSFLKNIGEMLGEIIAGEPRGEVQNNELVLEEVGNIEKLSNKYIAKLEDRVSYTGVGTKKKKDIAKEGRRKTEVDKMTPKRKIKREDRERD